MKGFSILLFLFVAILLILWIIQYFISKFRNHSELFSNLQIQTSGEREKSEERARYTLPKNIFIYWHEKNIENKFVKRNIEHLQKILPSDYQLRIYNEENIKEEMDEADLKFMKNSKQHFADYVRLLLLKKYGGFWFDATIVIKNVDFLEEIHQNFEKSRFDIFLFQYSKRNAGDNIHDKYFENWFIVAPLHSIFIRDMFNEYKQALEIGFLNYKKRLSKENLNMEGIFGNENDVYLMQHAIIRKLLKTNQYIINYDLADHSMFKFQDDCGWDNHCLANKLLKIDSEENMYAVKLVGGQREFMNQEREKDISDLFLNIEKEKVIAEEENKIFSFQTYS